MDRWPLRWRFKELVSDHREAKGLSKAEMAQSLGLAESTLRNYLYNRQLVPSLGLLQRAAKLFGVSVTEFVDDPGITGEGIPKRALLELNERDRAILREVCGDLLTLEAPEKQAVLAIWRAGVKAIRARGTKSPPSKR